MKRRVALNQTTVWILALLGSCCLFGMIFLISSKVAQSYQQQWTEDRSPTSQNAEVAPSYSDDVEVESVEAESLAPEPSSGH